MYAMYVEVISTMFTLELRAAADVFLMPPLRVIKARRAAAAFMCNFLSLIKSIGFFECIINNSPVSKAIATPLVKQSKVLLEPMGRC